MSRHLLSSARPSLLAPIVGAALLFSVAQARGEFIVNSWNLGSQVVSGSQDDTHTFNVVQNPFIDDEYVEIPPSFAQAAYSFTWDDSGASFHTDAAHHALDVPQGSSLFSRSSGFIFIEPSDDTVLTISGFYNFALPPGWFLSRLEATVRDMTTNVLLWGQASEADSFGGQFVSGTHSVATPGGGILLMGGHTHRLRYQFLLDAFGGGTNAIGTGDGEIQWTLTVVPECHVAFLLAFAGPFLMRRRRRAWAH